MNFIKMIIFEARPNISNPPKLEETKKTKNTKCFTQMYFFDRRCLT